jgi:hypothetical protein
MRSIILPLIGGSKDCCLWNVSYPPLPEIRVPIQNELHFKFMGIDTVEYETFKTETYILKDGAYHLKGGGE